MSVAIIGALAVALVATPEQWHAGSRHHQT
jgi:hypothetical protein